ncbi:MAG: YD repeat protein [Candidatus Magasanikbacteria bacterium GW2011_GWD2_43_18]|uniref:YD repeat protein n=1 Tax=Candidatus Magasanikbacteria bacterium GW2011_GWE2_42_7 TaxID=1619052 RepID=A0A0G1BFN0_9BACT|nr:MAG: YD repeat protein [Candidatus Magasanikbacteria bacterium GW2011_GWC2_42_27]KKS72195.1 MAG: YD repeat protein [Candidatus Magasanikbacteria bacterium GW2011_GWE2_42_7]KKT04921.1 MAG: YD repeat protein [Candidatus Magasanikbacteria bacterium GW2011_GWD2_43_18]KKT25391.1 MAG: YD repeat protein [Candidatus Magasanikbacteria bacterium GW2011_GWA2_43_9]HBB37803.1 hypothetical protein [Candidatus Magasanikbacteria bacterium]
MSSFTRKKIEDTHRVCFRLKEAREAAGFSIEQMSEKTKLSKTYIHALETCEFQDLPSGTVYQKNFIKRYLSVLNIPSTSYIQQFLLEEEYAQEIQKVQHPHRPKSVFSFLALPALMKYVGIAVVLFSTLGYLGWQVHRILEPPMLTLISPDDGHITSEEHITIRGISAPETDITINGKGVSYTREGQFEQSLDLVEGVNTIVVEATKKHGQKTTETRYVTQRKIQQISVGTAEETKS